MGTEGLADRRGHESTTDGDTELSVGQGLMRPRGEFPRPQTPEAVT